MESSALKRVLALDIGTNCGAALWCNDKIYFQTFKLAKPKDADGTRFSVMSVLIEYHCEHFDLEAIIYEAPGRLPSMAAYAVLNGLAGVIYASAAPYRVPVFKVAPAQVKKFATGSGKANKDDMIRAARERGWGAMDDHQADAGHILAWGLANLVVGQP